MVYFEDFTLAEEGFVFFFFIVKIKGKKKEDFKLLMLKLWEIASEDFSLPEGVKKVWLTFQ